LIFENTYLRHEISSLADRLSFVLAYPAIPVHVNDTAIECMIQAMVTRTPEINRSLYRDLSDACRGSRGQIMGMIIAGHAMSNAQVSVQILSR